MNLKSTVGIYVSGVVAYGIFAATTGINPHGSASSARGAFASWIDPVSAARADSGTRLKAEFVLGDDGSKDYQLAMVPWSVVGAVGIGARPASLYWDASRNEECAFQIAGDHALRCVPVAGGLVVDPWGYLDAACTQRGINIAPPKPGCAADVPKYAFVYDVPGATCPQPGYYPAHLYPIGAFVGSSQPCYTLNAGVCQSNGSCPILDHAGSETGYATYAVDGEVPAASFSPSTPGHDP